MFMAEHLHVKCNSCVIVADSPVASEYGSVNFLCFTVGVVVV